MKYTTYLPSEHLAAQGHQAARSVDSALLSLRLRRCLSHHRYPHPDRPRLSRVLQRGELVPDDITVELWKARIEAAGVRTSSNPISMSSARWHSRNAGQPKSWMSSST